MKIDRYSVRLLAAILFAGVPAPAAAAAADAKSSAQEVWSGVYQCSAMQGEAASSPAYTSSIRMIVEGTSAVIAKESADLRETLSGEVSPDGTLRLEGSGRRKESSSPAWRYRFDGKFEGARFRARGMMFSANLATKLRDCSMTLTRIQGSASSRARAQAPASAVAQPETSAKPRHVADAAPPPARDAAAQKEPAKRLSQRAAETIEKVLDFSRGNDAATMEGTVSRGSPHRYTIIGTKGQQLSGSVRSDDGARFDFYEPGSSVTTLPGGFVVQGARLGGTPEGTHVDVELPADGKYLLLVRSTNEQAFYTLELAAQRGAPSTMERWWKDRTVWIGVAVAAAVLSLVMLVRRKRDRRLFRPD